jgi:hypothetical protein
MRLLTEDEIDYELGIHDCGQNPYCDRYRSCGLNEKPFPSDEKIKAIIEIGTKQLLEKGFDPIFINAYFQQKYPDYKG